MNCINSDLVNLLTPVLSLSFHTSMKLLNLATNLLDVIITDFKKAFDTINHSILINELEILYIGYPLLGWIKSYISGRKQYLLILIISDIFFIETNVRKLYFNSQ